MEHQATILVVDDEQVVLRVVCEMLESRGYLVEACEDGGSAVERLRAAERPFDLILLDLIMPRMGGTETFHALRAIAPDVPILVCSGYSPGEEIQLLLDAGARGLLRKPLHLNELLAKVEAICPLQGEPPSA